MSFMFPPKMLGVTIIVKEKDFPSIVEKIAELESFMLRESNVLEELSLNEYCPTNKLDNIRQIETNFQDLKNLIPEPKEKLLKKLRRIYSAVPVLDPIFTDWTDLSTLEEKLITLIADLTETIKSLRNDLESIDKEESLLELLIKGFKQLQTDYPFETKENETTLVGILNTSKIEDAKEFASMVSTHSVIPLTQNKYMIYAQGKKGEISRLQRSLKTVRWENYDYQGSTNSTKVEIIADFTKKFQQIEPKLKAIKTKLNDFALENRLIIRQLGLTIDSYKNIIRMYIAAKKTEKTVIIQGWIPKREYTYFETELYKHSTTLVLQSDPTEESKELRNIPVVQSQISAVRAFQSLVGLYGLPSAKEIDPSLFFIFTFSLFYGIMFGDAGHGLIFILVGLLGIMAKGLKRSIRQVFLLVLFVGISSFIMGGFVFGEAFGFHLHDVLHIHSLFGFPYPLLSPVEDLIDVFNLTLIIGAIHISLGLILRSINQILHKELEELIKETWAQMFLYGAILYFLSSLQIISFGIDIPIIIALICLIFGVGLTLFGQGIYSIITKKSISKILSSFLSGTGMGLMNLLESFSGFVSGTISYGRILAMLIAHTVFLTVINTLAEGQFILVQIIILVIGNVFVLVLEGLLVFVQDLRLHFYEWFSRFYKGSGIPFLPVYVFNKTIDSGKSDKYG